jgi:hypothetical protein
MFKARTVQQLPRNLRTVNLESALGAAADVGRLIHGEIVNETGSSSTGSRGATNRPLLDEWRGSQAERGASSPTCLSFRHEEDRWTHSTTCGV